MAEQKQESLNDALKSVYGYETEKAKKAKGEEEINLLDPTPCSKSFYDTVSIHGTCEEDKWITVNGVAYLALSTIGDIIEFLADAGIDVNENPDILISTKDNKVKVTVN